MLVVWSVNNPLCSALLCSALLCSAVLSGGARQALTERRQRTASRVRLRFIARSTCIAGAMRGGIPPRKQSRYYRIGIRPQSSVAASEW